MTEKTSFVGDEERNCEVIFEWVVFIARVLSVNTYYFDRCDGIAITYCIVICNVTRNNVKIY